MGNISTSGAATHKAGDGMSTSIPKAAWDEWLSGAEAFVNVETRYNWSDNFATLNSDVKHIVSDTVASLVAMNAISYDMSGYSSRTEAETMLDFLRDTTNRNIKTIEEQKKKDFMTGA